MTNLIQGEARGDTEPTLQELQELKCFLHAYKHSIGIIRDCLNKQLDVLESEFDVQAAKFLNNKSSS